MKARFINENLDLDDFTEYFENIQDKIGDYITFYTEWPHYGELNIEMADGEIFHRNEIDKRAAGGAVEDIQSPIYDNIRKIESAIGTNLDWFDLSDIEYELEELDWDEPEGWEDFEYLEDMWNKMKDIPNLYTFKNLMTKAQREYMKWEEE